jgi:hypothetical protein
MSAAALLSRLERVKAIGRGRWIARCPAHDDGRPSLSVRELDDGRVLAYCFASCSVADVLAAVGLDFDALYPKRAVDHRVHRERDPHNPRDVLIALADETQLAALVCARIAYGFAVDCAEVDRLMTAVGRIATAAALFKPHPAKARRAFVPRAELDEVAHA